MFRFYRGNIFVAVPLVAVPLKCFRGPRGKMAEPNRCNIVDQHSSENVFVTCVHKMTGGCYSSKKKHSKKNARGSIDFVFSTTILLNPIVVMFLPTDPPPLPVALAHAAYIQTAVFKLPQLRRLLQLRAAVGGGVAGGGGAGLGGEDRRMGFRHSKRQAGPA